MPTPSAASRRARKAGRANASRFLSPARREDAEDVAVAGVRTEDFEDQLRQSAMQRRVTDFAVHGGEAVAAPALTVRNVLVREDVQCSTCEERIPVGDDFVVSLDGRPSKFTTMRVRLVYNALVTGGGYAGLYTTQRNLAIAEIGHKSYRAILTFLYQQAALMWTLHTTRLAATMEAVHALSDVPRCADGCLEVAVSYDGTWMTRGHRSHVAAAFVMDVERGYVLDFEVLSNFCQECHKKEKTLSPADFARWKLGHTGCANNFDGKSGAMEVEGALRLWRRSEQRGYRYTTFIGDGDCAAYNAVSALNNGRGPYTTPVVKEECVNHVAKRIGTRLRNLKKDTREAQTTRKGKTVMRSRLAGKGGLTDASIDAITKHYGQTIRSLPVDGSVEQLRTRILAIYAHARSSDAEPFHQSCPPGEDSWCWVKRAEAAGEAPASHETKKLYLAGVAPDLLKRVCSVFADLTTSSLLGRCLRKETQNRNESLHSKLWRKCLKVKFSQLQRVNFAASVTSLEHNCGDAAGNVLCALGLLHQSSIAASRRSLGTPVCPRAKRAKRSSYDRDEPSTSYAPGSF